MVETDGDLIERIKAGDQLALKTLYARHHVKIFRFAMRILRSESNAEDVVSEVFLDVWRSAANFEGRSEASTFLLSVARNKAYTVASFNGMPTHAWWPLLADDPALVHGFTETPRLVVFAGGVPVRVDGAVVGAVGVSGGSSEQDRAIAEAGVDSLASP